MVTHTLHSVAMLLVVKDIVPVLLTESETMPVLCFIFLDGGNYTFAYGFVCQQHISLIVNVASHSAVLVVMITVIAIELDDKGKGLVDWKEV